jgi:hypothetical protein
MGNVLSYIVSVRLNNMTLQNSVSHTSDTKFKDMANERMVISEK